MMMPDQANVTDPSAANPPPPGRFGTIRIVARVIACLVAIPLLGLGVLILWEGIDSRWECHVAEGAEVCEMTLDVGEIGQHTGTLTQIAAFTCEQSVRLEPTLRPDEDPMETLKGLWIRVSIRDKNGTEVASCELPDPDTGGIQDNGAMQARFIPMAKGEYDVVVDVTRAVPALAGRPVRLVSGYVLCGIEWMSATIGIAIGAAGAIIGGSIAAALWFTRRRGFQ